MALEISSEITDEKAIIRIEGEVDVSNASELRDALDTALADGAKEVEADFAEVAYIDSTGIGVFSGCRTSSTREWFCACCCKSSEKRGACLFASWSR